MLAECGQLDVAMLIDESSSIGLVSWLNYVVPFTKSIANALPIAPDLIRFGLAKFGTDAKMVFNLNELDTVALVSCCYCCCCCCCVCCCCTVVVVVGGGGAAALFVVVVVVVYLVVLLLLLFFSPPSLFYVYISFPSSFPTSRPASSYVALSFYPVLPLSSHDLRKPL